MYPFEFGHEQHNVVQKIELFSVFGKVKQSIEKASSILNRILEEYVLFFAHHVHLPNALSHLRRETTFRV